MRIVISLLLLVTTMFFAKAQNVGQKSKDTTIINYTDIQGNKQGKWVRKYDAKTIAYEGYFKNNKLVGVYKRYFKNGELSAIIKYNQTGSVGYATMFYLNKNKFAEGKYVDQNKKDSVWNYYNESGILIAQEKYDKGLKSGISTDYYLDGKPCQTITYLKGKKDGLWKTYFTDGKVKLETKHVNDERNGPFNIYYPSGRPYILGKYKNDLPDGKWTIYEEDGKVKNVLEYVNGKMLNEDKYDAEFTAKMKEYQSMKGKIPEPSEENFFKEGKQNLPE